MRDKVINVALLIYNHPVQANAPTIMEYVESFENHSKFNVFKVNTAFGFPKGIKSLRFSVIVFHYSLFGHYPFKLNEQFRKYITLSKESVKIALFQDEMQYCVQRFTLINQLKIDIIYSLLEHRYFDEVYFKNTSVRHVRQALAGYVSDRLIDISNRYFIRICDRKIDVGYRARNLSYFYGRGAREKSDIADKFIDAAKGINLKLDISTSDQDRIYGDDWYQFIGNCRFMLGVMAGTSIFDLTGEIKAKVDQYLLENPDANFCEVERDVLEKYEEIINYRTISPRIFECAALRTCMILYRDSYQGTLIAGKHYLSLEKDFSNIESVFEQMLDEELIQSITDNAYQDLILSGKYHYREFIQDFDNTLIDCGCDTFCHVDQIQLVKKLINKDAWLRNLTAQIQSLRLKKFPGRKYLKTVIYKLGYKSG